MKRIHQTLVVLACVALAASTAVLAVPGEVTSLQWCSGPKTCLQWNSVTGATQYKVYRGERASLPCILNPSLDSCDHGLFATPTTGTTIPENPSVGRFFWFIICAKDGSGEGSPGLATAGIRTVNDTGACLPSCAPSGSSCTIDNDCCSSNCIAGTCQSACCQPTAAFCTIHSDCCSGVCSAGQCQPPCTPNGGSCFTNAECCSSFCQGGMCTNLVCNPGFFDCNNNPVDGCEINTTNDPQNCGNCGLICNFPNASASCTNSQCTMGPCSAGYGNCNADPSDGCETGTTSDPNNCGGCALACNFANASAACTNSQCVMTSCNPGFADCNGLPADGCEVNIANSPQNCGGCNLVCSFPNANAACISSQCTMTSCNVGYADCNQNPVDGCEISTQSDPNNCSLCGMTCSSNHIPVPTCSGGVCNGACASGFSDCNGNKQSDGCETGTTSDPNNCGGCALACNFANATAACVSSSCTIASCNSGFGDCNANPADGCEANTNTSPSHCGGCGLACSSNHVPTPTCSAGNCTGTCATGFADCNGDKRTDGCEINTQNDTHNCGICGNVCVIGAICSAGSCFIP